MGTGRRRRGSRSGIRGEIDRRCTLRPASEYTLMRQYALTVGCSWPSVAASIPRLRLARSRLTPRCSRSVRQGYRGRRQEVHRQGRRDCWRQRKGRARRSGPILLGSPSHRSAGERKEGRREVPPWHHALPRCSRGWQVFQRWGRSHPAWDLQGHEADVATRGDRIAAIGQLSHVDAKLRIDASGKVVAPSRHLVHPYHMTVSVEALRLKTRSKSLTAGSHEALRGCRRTLPAWHVSVVEAIPCPASTRVANTDGTFGTFLRTFRPPALRAAPPNLASGPRGATEPCCFTTPIRSCVPEPARSGRRSTCSRATAGGPQGHCPAEPACSRGCARCRARRRSRRVAAPVRSPGRPSRDLRA